MPPEKRVFVYTIGFAQKKAKQFFEILQSSGVRVLMDIRLNNSSQLAGFAKKDDLAYFLRTIAGIDYVYVPELAPTEDLLTGYKKKTISWQEYEQAYRQLLRERQAEGLFTVERLDRACFLCSEPKPDRCHRRLAAEYLQGFFPDIQIVHL